MSSSESHQRRYHVGRRSTAFDIVPSPLVVVEHIDGIAPGSVEQSTPDGVKTLQPAHRKGSPTAGVRAYEVEPGGIYRVCGIEHRPVAVEKFVRYDDRLGFVEIDPKEFHEAPRAAAPSLDLPQLQGTEGQVTWGLQVRAQMLDTIKSAGREDLLPAFRRRKFASFYIQLAHHSDRWIVALEDVLKTKSRPS